LDRRRSILGGRDSRISELLNRFDQK